jgi:hypothetical protein
MKSAYELAMERLNKERGPERKLTDEQKAALAEIDRKYEAKIAEARLGGTGRLSGAQSYEELATMQGQNAHEIRSLEERRDREKEAIWNLG